MTPEELVGSYLQGERDFRGIKLIQSPFDVEGNEIDLRGSVLNHINATCAYFDRAINIGALEYAILADASFQDAHIPDQLICRGGNLIWRTIMPDGTIKLGPQCGDGEGR
ncbi:MAG: hypothetical protein HC903_10275 [Methylacidiphilales bacterium]|nr:hypothetical protein [Candidatus Methylacidiphilales bacterium]NJR17649.1 hypothetical protein [Calothrix sp. CSU_2_0]